MRTRGGATGESAGTLEGRTTPKATQMRRLQRAGAAVRCGEFARVWRVVLLPTSTMCVTLIVACGGVTTDPVTKTQAIAFARRVNVRNTDAPRMATLVAGFETKNGPPYSGCTAHVGVRDQIAAVESPWLLRSTGRRRSRIQSAVPVPPVEGVHSVVYVMREPVVARRNVASARSAAAPKCVTRLSSKETSGRFIGHESYKLRISGSSIPFPLAGVDGYGLRLRGTLAAAVYHLKKRPAYYEDTFGFAIGPAEIVLCFVGVERPFPLAEERRLLSLLYGRAKVQKLA